MSIRLLASFLTLSLTAAPNLLAADEAAEVRDWLDRMSLAVNQLTYQGTLVYVRGHQMETMRVFHSAADGHVRERLVSMDGTPREVIRHDNLVRFIYPQKKEILVDSRSTEPWFPIIAPEQAVDPKNRYTFRVGKVERVSGLDAQTIHIKPRDGFRYGYRLWLERETGMLLKSQLLDEAGRPLEQVAFTELTIGGPIRMQDLNPGIRSENVAEIELPEAPAGTAATTIDDGIWRVATLPRGFQLSAYQQGQGKGLQHLVYTDGLASVSVYVEPVRDDDDILTGASHMGPVNMYGVRKRGHAVTAVGEVPLATVRAMAEGANIKSGDATAAR